MRRYSCSDETFIELYVTVLALYYFIDSRPEGQKDKYLSEDLLLAGRNVAARRGFTQMQSDAFIHHVKRAYLDAQSHPAETRAACFADTVMDFIISMIEDVPPCY